MVALNLSPVVAARPCRLCLVVKPADAFSSKGRKRPNPRCKACESGLRSARRAELKRSNPAALSALDAANNRRRAYGLTADAFEALWASQGGSCAVCLDALIRGPRKFHIDHDHLTGAVRGIVCPQCNVAVAMVKEDADRARAVAAYLDTHRNSTSAP